MATERRSVPQYIGGGAPFAVETIVAESRHTLAVRGELDRETTPRLAAAVQRSLGDSATRIELDLAGVTFMDSQGLRILLESKRRSGDATEFVIVRPSGQVERLLQATGVAEILGLGDA